MRKNNINDMTITEQFQRVLDDLCEDYCKYYAKYGKGKDGNKLNEACRNCPMNRV